VRRQDRQKHGLSVYTFDQAWSELQFLMRTLLLLRRVFESVEVVRLQNFLSWRMESAMYLLARAQDEQGKVSYDSLPILMSEAGAAISSATVDGVFIVRVAVLLQRPCLCTTCSL